MMSPLTCQLVPLIRIVVATVVATVGCTHSRPHANMGQIYNDAAQAPDYLRNPVIVIPGILGSRLVDDETDRVVWGDFDRSSANPKEPEGIRLVSLPMAEGTPLHELRDAVRSDGALDQMNVHILGVPIHVSAYAQILSSLGVGGYQDSQTRSDLSVAYTDEHFTCFQFDYDWRRDISETAQQFDKFVLAREKYVIEEMRRRYGIVVKDVKFDIVAHSMGGLLARYYLRYGGQPLPEDGSLPQLTWAGSRHVKHAVLVGTPNAGSVTTFRELLEGSRMSKVLPKYPPAIVGTFPAAYQLLPQSDRRSIVDATDTTQPVNIYDPDLWKQMQWGLASPEQDKVLRSMLPDVADRESRLSIALDHQRKCLVRAEQFHAALDIPTEPPGEVSLHLFAGDADETDSVMGVDFTTGDIEVISTSAGDGIVTRASAVGRGHRGETSRVTPVSQVQWTSKVFLPSDHLELTRNAVFVDNVLSLLLESSPVDYRQTSANRKALAERDSTQGLSRLPLP